MGLEVGLDVELGMFDDDDCCWAGFVGVLTCRLGT